MNNFINHLKIHKWGYLLGVLIVVVIVLQAIYKPINFNTLRGDLTGSITGDEAPIFKVQLPDMKTGDYFEKNFMDVCSDCLRGSDIQLNGGDLPPGLQLDNGYLRGKLTTPGTYSFDMKLGSKSVRTYLFTVE